ncbi:MAG: guanylate kinase [Thermotogae bacterium]|nr:guanylate kinase [Thermotogota bacterium]RKX46377.1 MAG: guanylate kinase [Thermotogota bacterium]
MKGILYVVTGPSGVGKSTIIREVLKRFDNLVFSVSYTTRPKRPGEENGTDYFFVDQRTFMKLKDRGEFLEWAQVHGYYYGTSKSQVEGALRQGNHVLLDVDVQGAIKIMELYPDAVFIFIAPPTFSDLKNRLMLRQTESEKSLQRRLEDARWELSQAYKFEYLIVNRELTSSIKGLESIVVAEQLKISRMREFLGQITP